jgi:hypothetical protein
MIENKGKFVIKFEKKDKEFIENLNIKALDEGYNKAKNFLEYGGEINPIRICFVYSPEEYLFFSGYPKYEKWMSACTGYHNTIYIFSPSVIEKYTLHKVSEILKILIHEITHFFYGYSSMKGNIANLPLWDEGIANYIADKKINKKIDFEISTISNYNQDYSKNYILGYKIIESVMNNFGDNGNKKIIEFLEKSINKENDEDLFRIFEEVFGMSVGKLIKLKGGI